jgi:hypothetical protein
MPMGDASLLDKHKCIQCHKGVHTVCAHYLGEVVDSAGVSFGEAHICRVCNDSFQEQAATNKPSASSAANKPSVSSAANKECRRCWAWCIV